MALRGTGEARVSFAWGVKLESTRDGPRAGKGTRLPGLTLRQGLSVWAPSRLNPFPGWNWPPTAKAMRVE